MNKIEIKKESDPSYQACEPADKKYAADPTSDKTTAIAQAEIAKMDLDALPEDVAFAVADYLDPPDLAALMLFSSWHSICSHQSIWTRIARVVGCPLEGDLPARDQVKEFVQRLLKILPIKQKLNETPKTDVKPLTKDRITHIRDLIIADDIYTFWYLLGRLLNPNATIIDIFGEPDFFFEAEKLIAKSSQFKAWFAANRVQLNAATLLNLDCLTLSHLPKQLYELEGLRRLFLTNNQLSCAPKELCTLTGLQVLDIRKNPLTKFPQHLFGLPNLTTLYLRCKKLKPVSDAPIKLPTNLKLDQLFFEGIPIELNHQIGAALGFSVPANLSTCDLLQNELHYIKPLTFDEAHHLIQWRRAQDILRIWKQLNIRINPGATTQDTFGVNDDYFRTSAEFPKWLALHKEELGSLEAFETFDNEPPLELCTPSLIGKLPCKTKPNWREETCRQIISYVDSPTADLKLFKKRLVDSTSYRGLPSDIAALLKRNPSTCGQVRTLHNWIKARNKLDIWGRLCRLLNVGVETVPVLLEYYNSSQAEIEAAAQFPTWFEKHLDQLAKLESLDLSNLKLFFLPEEIGQLTALKSLNLSSNEYLIALPDHICDLPQLEELNLASTKFEDLKRDVPKLRHLKKLNLLLVPHHTVVGQFMVDHHNFQYNDGVYEKKPKENK